MASIADIEAALQTQLPADLHTHIPALAQVLARLSDASLAPEEARRRLADPAFHELLHALVGHRVPLGSGDYMAVGDISQWHRRWLQNNVS